MALDIDTELVDAATTFAREYVAPRAAQWELSGGQAVDGLRAAAGHGLLGFEAPVEYGGRGAGILTKLAVCEALARADMAFAFALVNTQNIAHRLSHDPGAETRRDLIRQLIDAELFGATALTEPDAGSDFASIAMRATRTSDGWRLDGTKAWITNVQIADIYVVYAQTDPAAGARGIAAFLVDGRRGGFHRKAPYRLIGGHGIGTGEFELQAYHVPDHDVLSPPGEGFKHALGTVNGARVYVASMCCGMMADALDSALEYGERRTAFGQPLLDHQGLRWSLADVATQLEALRAVTERAGARIAAGQDAVLAAAMAKKLAGEVTLPAISACIQAMGANGLRQSGNLGRHLACARIAAFTDGSTEMMNERIGASLRRGRR